MTAMARHWVALGSNQAPADGGGFVLKYQHPVTGLDVAIPVDDDPSFARRMQDKCP
ncbi:MAG: hypothetical protein ABIF71_07265 [Planctomycetota bacterium]